MRKRSLRAQVGIGTVVVFVVMLFVASISAGVLFNTTSVASTPAGVGGQESGAGVSNGLVVVGQTGTAVTEDGIGRVNLTVTAGSATDEIDLSETTVTWVGPAGSYNVAHGSTGATGDARFHVRTRSDPNDSAPVVDSRDDRLVLSFDLGRSDDVAAVGEFGERLGPGDQALLVITTGEGDTNRVRLAAPRSLGRRPAVVL